jgi:putative hydrolase of the HAD superfamily
VENVVRPFGRPSLIAGYHRLVRFRAVFFDAGETLVHPHPSFPELFAEVVTREGYPRHPSAVREASHVVMRGFSEAATRNTRWTTSPDLSRAFWSGVYVRMLDALELPGENGLADALYATFTDRANYRLFDDVMPAIDALAGSGVALGIVSNFEPWLEDLLGDLGVRDSFAVRVISGAEGVEKPDPRIYRLALERARVEPRDAAFVGDNLEFDVHPPAALGMFPVLVDRHRRHRELAGAARVSDLRELAELLS